MSRWLRSAFPALWAGACVAVWTSAASASDGHDVVVLGDGPNGQAIARGVASRLMPPFSEADSSAFRAALGTKGVRAIAAAAKGRGDAEFVSKARAAARKVQANRAILIRVDKSRKTSSLHVWVIDTSNAGGADVDEDVHVATGSTWEDESDAAWTAVAAAFPAPAEPPAAAPEPVATPEPTPTEAPPHAAPVDDVPLPVGEHTRAASLAAFGVEVQGGSRHFSYVDRLTGSLRPYDLFVAPVAKIDGEFYPLAHAHVPVASGLGIQGSFARAFGLSSQDPSGSEKSTSWQSFDVGLRERIPLGTSFILGIDAGYEDTSFVFDAPVTPTEQVPSVDYKMLRAGLDGRVVVGDISIHAGANYLDVLSTGDFGALFPRATVAGVAASLGVSQMIARGLEASFAVEYTRVFYSLLPKPGDAYVAGGALDEMADISLGLAYLF